MAIFAFTPVVSPAQWQRYDMVDERLTFIDTIFESTTEIAQATFFRLHYSDATVEFQGNSLQYRFEGGDVAEITAGTITGLTVTLVNGGPTVLSATGVAVRATEFSALLGSGNSTALFNLLLPGNDLISAGAGADRLVGHLGNDTLNGGGGDDVLSGEAGADSLSGGGGNDRLDGAAGLDALFGGAGRDVLIGGAGKDVMSGGAGADTFVFRATGDSAAARANADVITDFRAGTDRIDLRGIDAYGATGADDAFLWIGTGSFSNAGAGEVRARLFDNAGTENDFTMIEIDTDGDLGVEMTIRLTGLHDLGAGDFLM